MYYTQFDGVIDMGRRVRHGSGCMSLEPLYRTIGSVIRAKRRQRDWSQEVLAEKLKISRGTLANIEAGRQRVLVHQLYAIAAAFELKPAELLPAPVTVTGTPEAFPLPEGLNAQQKEQLARLIQSANATSVDKGHEKK